MVAEALGYGMNRWTTDSDFKTTLEDAAVDYSFSWCVAHTTLAPRPEHYEAEDAPLWPQVSRLSPWEFGFDNRAKTWRQSRMLWHEYRLDKDDLERRAKADRKLPKEQREGWILEAAQGLPYVSYPEGKRPMLWKRDGPERNEVKVLEVFLPSHQIDGAPGPADGFNGTKLTIGVGANDTGGAYLKPPEPFFGPRWGPYTVGGAYIVPDCPFPLSLLMATAGHIEQSSRLAQAVDAQVAAYKRLLLASAGAPHLAKLIKDGRNDFVYSADGVSNLEQLIRQYEIGGTTPGNVAAEQRAINKRNRAMGMDEVQRGNVTGEGTATEVQLAVEAALGRQGYIKGRFQDFVKRVGKTVAWYLFHTDEIVFALGPEAIEALGLEEDQEAWFVGGSFDDGSGTTFDDLGLEIEPFSMERQADASLRQRGEFIANLVQLAPALAALGQMGADVKGIIDAYGDSYGMPNASRFFPGIESVDPSVIQPAEAEPRLARDVGIAGLLRQFQGGRGAGNSGARGVQPADFAARAGGAA